MTSGLVFLALLGSDAFHCKADLASAVRQAAPGKPFYVAIVLTPEPGWHTYWENPGDSGMATSVKWTLPAGWTAGPIEWPIPESVTGPSGLNYLYPDPVWLPVQIFPPKNAPLGTTATLKAKVQWLACKEACIMGGTDLSVNISVGAKSMPAFGFQQIRTAVSSLPQQAPAGIRAIKDGSFIALNLPPYAPKADLGFYSADALIDATEPAKIVSGGGGQWIRLKISSYAPPKPQRLRGLLVVPRGQTFSNGSRALILDVPIDAKG